MIQRLRCAPLALALCAVISAGGATVAQELNAKTAMDNFQDENVLAYMAGLYHGMTWYNARLIQAGQPRLFCPPENESLDGPRVVSAMRLYADKPENRRLLEAPVGLLMLVAMQATFPCPVAR